MDKMTEKPWVDRDFLLERSPEMAGWTYTIIPEIAPDPHAPFGMVKVRGTIDGVEIRDYHLMPGLKGSGVVFLSIKAALRKKIKKEAGDTVHIVLWPDNAPPTVPEDLSLCLRDDAEAQAFFDSLTDGQRHQYVRWIDSAKSDRVRVERIARMIDRLARRLKFADKEPK